MADSGAMQTVTRVSIVQSVIGQLRDQISRGAWPMGHRIPSEGELAESLGVSRPSVREGVRALVHAGLLSARQGDGTYVVAVDETQVALQRRLQTAEVLDILDVRRGLDLAAAGLAAQRRDEEDLGVMRASLEGRAEASARQDREGFGDHDVAFHLAVAAAAKNPILSDLYTGLARAIRASVQADDCFDAAAGAPMSLLHQELFDAIEGRQAARATDCARRILDLQQAGLSL